MLLTVPPSVLVALVLGAALCGARVSPYTNNRTTGYLAPMPQDYGGVVVSGGETNNGMMDSVESSGTRPLPDLPNRIESNTLTAVGPVLYCCDMFSCRTLNTSASDLQWETSVTLPVQMSGHSAMAVGTHIWFTYFNQIYDLDTETNQFVNYSTPMEIYSDHCAVSNGMHGFLIGAGQDKKEIWVSTDEYSPLKWKLVGKMLFERSSFGCVWLSNYIVITGGWGALFTSEVFDTNTFTTSLIADLVDGRCNHQMCVVDGKPAVVGGDNHNMYFKYIETYDIEADLWSKDNRHLDDARSYFGLAQFVV